MNEETKIEDNIINPQMIEIMIPECCREGREDCPHSVKKPKKVKRNIGL